MIVTKCLRVRRGKVSSKEAAAFAVVLLIERFVFRSILSSFFTYMLVVASFLLLLLVINSLTRF